MEAAEMMQTTSVPGWQPPTHLSDCRIHLVGIGGSGMSGLAAFLLRHGAHVTGTDRQTSDVCARLAEAGARIAYEQTADAVPSAIDCVVASAAVPEQHPEIAAARRRGIPVLKYAQLLGILMDRQHGIAVSGTHGKSTTSAWLTYALRQGGLDPSFVVGAEAEQLGGGSGVGDGPHFVAEACEYDRSFHNLRPRSAVILNVEEDHLDCYRDLAEIVASFREFAQLVPERGYVLLNADDARCREIAATLATEVETFGFAADADWRAAELALDAGCYAVTIRHEGQEVGRVRLGLPGRHNVLNALAVCALAAHAGVPWNAIQTALGEFRGARRRLDLRAEIAGVTLVDDYAHHPTEIRATLAAARERFRPQRLWCIFQPHQHSRTRFLMRDFARSFDLADRTIVPRIYFVRDSERERQAVRATDLVDLIQQRGRTAEHVAELHDVVTLLAEQVRAGDLVLTMGAGDIWKVADGLAQRLRELRPQ